MARKSERQETKRKRMTRQQREKLRKKKKRRRIILLVVELLVLAVLGVVAYAVVKLDKMDHKKLDSKKLEVYKDTGDYTNIALFGLDSRESELEGGVQSDCIMIASINNKTNDVKLVSIYRDTLLQQKNGSYEKANSAYHNGGPEEAIALLNRNFDLDIEKYMSVNFNALADVIDALGGIEIDMTDEEVFWTNGYCVETSKVVGRKTEELAGAGTHTLDGIQAVSYARIRYTSGDDFKRTERQRIVLSQVIKKAQKANLSTLNKILDKVLPQVSTNLTNANLLGIAANALNYKVGDMSGFPFEVTTSEEVKKHKGSYVVPVGFLENVSQLHEFLFGEEDYNPSDKVQEVNNDIIYLTGIKASNSENATGKSYQMSGSDDVKGTE